jgi:hypothetical protein
MRNNLRPVSRDNRAVAGGGDSNGYPPERSAGSVIRLTADNDTKPPGQP